MIPAVAPIRQPPARQRALQDAITEPADLLVDLKPDAAATCVTLAAGKRVL